MDDRASHPLKQRLFRFGDRDNSEDTYTPEFQVYISSFLAPRPASQVLIRFSATIK